MTAAVATIAQTAHLNIALDLAAAHGKRAKDITSLIVSEDGRAVTIGLGKDADDLAIYTSNRSFGM